MLISFSEFNSIVITGIRLVCVVLIIRKLSEMTAGGNKRYCVIWILTYIFLIMTVDDIPVIVNASRRYFIHS